MLRHTLRQLCTCLDRHIAAMGAAAMVQPGVPGQHKGGQHFAVGNNHTAQHYARHSMGQKQYELTAVTGNVLATVSDKRTAGTTAALPGGGTPTAGDPVTIQTWKPVTVTAHDYYPFGEYMPGRYKADTESHCFTATVCND